MKKGNQRLILLLALLVVVCAAIYVLPSTEAAATASSTIVEVDHQAPDFTVEMTNGESVTLSSLRGEVVLLNFWATWCPPCREELKHVEKQIIEPFASRGLVFLPISRGESRETVEQFLNVNGYSFAAGLDPDKQIYSAYAKDYIPRNYLINRHGVVVEATVGYDAKEFEALTQLIEMTLNAR
ncbi:MAG: TlpA disulfide reductase family protein [Rikenellaceae bacterium]